MKSNNLLINLKNKKMIVYIIKNKVNKKVYIGQTIRTFDLRYPGRGLGSERVYNYLVDCESYNKKNKKRRKLKYNKHLLMAMKKYGFENFEIEILDQCETIEQLNDREKYWIKEFDSTNNDYGYNIQLGGQNTKQTVEEYLIKVNKEIAKFFRIFLNEIETKEKEINSDNFIKIIRHTLKNNQQLKYKNEISKEITALYDFFLMKLGDDFNSSNVIKNVNDMLPQLESGEIDGEELFYYECQLY